MPTLQSHLLFPSPPPSSSRGHPRFRASLYNHKNPISASSSPPKLPAMENLRSNSETARKQVVTPNKDESMVVAKLHAIANAVADRAEMHAIIGVQRNDWNHLLLNSINSIILSASIMAGISGDHPHFKLASALLFTAAAGTMTAVNMIQPSQLAEEQRNATRLFNQLERSIRTRFALRSPTEFDVEEAMDRALALDKAYPLSLLPGMLEKFPKSVEPTVWWPTPKQLPRQHKRRVEGKDGNGWSKELEEEMLGVVRVMKERDEEKYVSFGELVLMTNKILAVSGPILAGVAAVGACLIGWDGLGDFPMMVGVLGGAAATVVNTLEHGGQLGLVFELARNCAGYYRRLEEEIELNLGEGDVEKREEGELFELKIALELGRSVSELKGFAKYGETPWEAGESGEFAGKLF